MSDRRLELANRRQALLAQSAAQRGSVAQAAREIELRLRSVDQAIHVVRGFVARPWLLAGSVAAIMMLGPRRLLGWVGRNVLLISTAWHILRRARSG